MGHKLTAPRSRVTPSSDWASKVSPKIICFFTIVLMFMLTYSVHSFSEQIKIMNKYFIINFFIFLKQLLIWLHGKHLTKEEVFCFLNRLADLRKLKEKVTQKKQNWNITKDIMYCQQTSKRHRRKELEKQEHGNRNKEC